MYYFDEWWDPAVEGEDIASPVITLVTTPNTTTTSAVLTVTDLDPGVGLVTIFASGAGFTGTQVVYSNGGFVSPFSSGIAAAISEGYSYTFRPATGWSPGETTLSVIAVDGNGNLATYTASWTLSASETPSFNGAAPFRDSVWRWRRRLHRQKCSVISVAIDDNYTPGPGFTLTALSLEIGRKPGIDRVPWRNGTSTNPSGSGSNSDGT